eukprot:8873092-Lingulodinium_polyedra.AAC.1
MKLKQGTASQRGGLSASSAAIVRNPMSKFAPKVAKQQEVLLESSKASEGYGDACDAEHDKYLFGQG